MEYYGVALRPADVWRVEWHAQAKRKLDNEVSVWNVYNHIYKLTKFSAAACLSC